MNKKGCKAAKKYCMFVTNMFCRSSDRLDKYYFPPDQCPHIDSYFSQVKKRPTYIRLEKEISTLRLTLLWENLKAWSPFLAGAAGIGVVAGGAYLVYQKNK